MKSKFRTLLQRLQPRALRRCVLPALLSVASAAALAAAPRDRLTLLVPDGADLSSWQVKVWTDSAAEEGIRLDLITDSALLALGNTAAATIAGLIMPDSAHLSASAAVVAAVKQYAFLGGKLMLVYDAGVLEANNAFPMTGNSRFADMVGVEYVLWNNGAGSGTMVGFGQVVGTAGRLDSLSFPPGKYIPYAPPVSLAATTLTTAFVPTSALDPGGSTVMTATVTGRPLKGIDDGDKGVREKRKVSLRAFLGLGAEDSGPLRFGKRNAQASKARDQHIFDRVTRPADQVGAVFSATTGAATTISAAAMAPADTALQSISGYGFGALGYYHYVTTGTFPGTVYLSSPEHGLVAGERTYGSGQLVFVNLPLGYFKAIGTDAPALHGFLNQFARDTVGISQLSVQPRGRGGLIYNWHVDDGEALTVDAVNLLNNTAVFKRGPFSIHFTAGPDVITVGDGNGMNLSKNKTAQDVVRRLGNLGKYATLPAAQKLPAHQLGSHGGWIHDYWGNTANEANSPDLTSLLTQNFNAIEAVTGRKITEYSSPQGNTPAWAITWMEKRGVIASYLVGDIGTGMIRSWRNGVRLSNKLWSSPVSVLGKYATFEEFDDFGVSDATSGQWLLDLQSFAVNHRTNRMFYTHPPGAAGHLVPVNALLARGDTLQAAGQFSWYTMTQMAEFSQRRVEATWSSSVVGTLTTFTASHPSSLADLTWLLPKSHYGQPTLTSGVGTVSSDLGNWIVTATSGTSLKFTSTAL